MLQLSRPLCICSSARPGFSRKLSSLPTLRVRVPPHPWYGGPPFQLQGSIDLRLHPSSPHRKINDFDVSLREIVSEGNHFQVYRGNLDTPGCPNVIVKISGNDAGAEAWVLRLEEEAQFYCNELTRLQGQVVPKFFGFYTGKRERGLSGEQTTHMVSNDCKGFKEYPPHPRVIAPTACMILEDCGNSIAKYGPDLETIPMSMRIGVMKHALRLHKEAGCVHGELDPGNVVMHDGDLDSMRLIDFKNCIANHRCKYGDRHTRVHHYCELNLVEHFMGIFKDGSRIDSLFTRDDNPPLPRSLRLSHRHARRLGYRKGLQGNYPRFSQPK